MFFFVLGFLGVLVASGASESNKTTCLYFSAPGNCREITCPSEKDFCLVNYTGPDNDIMKNPCMDEQTCQEYIQNNTLDNSTYCCQGNCSESSIVCETTPTPRSTTPVTGDNTCYSCLDSGSCEAFACPVGKDTCLSTVEVIGLGKNTTFSRNGSCVAPEDCKPQSYTFSYGYQLRSWVNVTCCTGNCSEPPGQVDLPSGTSSDVLCPICFPDEASCAESLYLLCFQGETSCVNMNLLHLGGGSNITIQGCGSENLCQLPENHTLGLNYQLIGQPDCSSTHQAVLSYRCQQNAAACWGCGLLLPTLLGVWMAAWLA